MNRSLNNPFVQIGLLLAAFALGTLLSLSVPNPYVASNGGLDEIDQCSPAPLDSASLLESFDESNQTLGVDAVPHRIDSVGRVC
jgi:hypothetical protein